MNIKKKEEKGKQNFPLKDKVIKKEINSKRIS